MTRTVIIGSGVAASAISQRLLENDPDTSILILEAGVRVKTRDYGIWENYLVTGRLPYEAYWDLSYPTKDMPGENANVGKTEIPLNQARVIAYGGSTLHWGGWAFRLKPEDFHLKANTGQGGDWPFGYDILEPYYCEAEHYLAVSGDSLDQTVPRSKGYPFKPFPFSLQDQPLAYALDLLGISYGNLPIARRGVSQTPSRHAPCHTTGTCKYCPFGARYVASDYLDDIRQWNDYPNLEVRLEAVVDVIQAADAHTVNAVTYTDRPSRKSVTEAADRVIVAAGTIESAKLLLRSQSPYAPTGLGNHSDMVGRNLVTHPYFIFTGMLPNNPLNLQTELNFPTLVSRHFDNETEQAKGKFILVNPPDPTGFSLAGKMRAGLSRAEIDALARGPQKLQLHGMIEVFGRFDNRITNLPGRNRMGLEETSVDYSADDSFKARIAEIKAHAIRIYGAMSATLNDNPSVSWRADHAGSTCRMSADQRDGVVDADLKVHGIDNLYVCSNAVFPAIGAVNPTLTLTALALRLGDHLSSHLPGAS
jgi:choline dehydrogenase-like flavoprotein